MLFQIDNPADRRYAALLLHREDNVAIARMALPAGEVVEIGDQVITLLDAIPAGHKLAVRDIGEEEAVLRYGNLIGYATRPIDAGQHVHVHNLGYREIDAAAGVQRVQVKALPPPAVRDTFLGYLRPDGRVGTRNYIAIVAASNCAAYTSELIAASFRASEMPDNVDGVVAFPHGEGCGQSLGPDTDQLRRTLQGVLDHPNVSAALILGLGCEVNQIEHYLGPSPNARPVPASLQGLTIQESGGTSSTVELARKQVKLFLDRAAAEKRVEVPASKIHLGLNCGGSDSFSGITANPALGFCSDLIAQQGGTAVLAETTEIFGAEHLLIRRARSNEVANQLLAVIEKYKAYLRQFGGSFNDNPSPGNKEGGLTNILEKSLGAVAKAGTSTLNGVVDFAERVDTAGFVFMNTPGYDPVSITGLAAGGANLIAFTTGRGSAIGFPSIPVLKIASNSQMFERMSNNMDVNAGRIATGDAAIEEVGREIYQHLLRVASGERTCAERLGHHEFSPWRIGPVL